MNQLTPFLLPKWTRQWEESTTKKEREILLTHLFQFQIRTLEFLTRFCLPQNQVYNLRKCKKKVVRFALETMPLENGRVIPGRLPFLSVLPKQSSKIWAMLSVMSSQEIKPAPPTDLHREFKSMEPYGKPHFIFDIDLTEVTYGYSAEQGVEGLGLLQRKPITIAGALSLIMHTDILKKYSLNVCGSSSKGGITLAPGFRMTDQGPELTRREKNIEEPGWICPSFSGSQRARSFRGLLGMLNPKGHVR